VALKSATGRGIVLAAVCGSSLAFLDGTVVNVALPHIGDTFDSNMDSLQWVVNGYTLMLAALVLTAGALGDHYGRRKVFIIGVVWFGLASALCGMAPNVTTLLTARVLQGIGAGLLTPGSLAIIQSTIRKQDRARAIGAWSGLGGVFTAAGPFIGGWLVDGPGWPWVFYINIPVVVLCLVATLKFVPESRDPAANGRFDLVGSGLGMIGLGGITFALVQSGARAASLTAAVIGVAAFVAFVVVERRRRAPMLPPAMFANRQFSAINAVTFGIYAGLSGVLFFLVMQLQVVSHYSAFAAGITMLPFTILMLLFSSRAGAVAERLGPRLPLTLGPALSAVGVLLLLTVGPHAPYLTHVLPGVLIIGIGMTITVAPLTAGVLAAADSSHAGVASGINNAVARAASLLAVAALPLAAGITGRAYQDPAAFDSGFRIAVFICAALFAASALTSVLLVRNPAKTAPEPTQPACRTQCAVGAPQLDPGLEPAPATNQ
jgi:EmrB/QacA subfamily drug resistance transporter